MLKNGTPDSVSQNKHVAIVVKTTYKMPVETTIHIVPRIRRLGRKGREGNITQGKHKKRKYIRKHVTPDSPAKHERVAIVRMQHTECPWKL